jgi:hypothetical protein
MSEAINRLGDAKNFVSLGYTHSALMAIDDAIKILQAAQAQAVTKDTRPQPQVNQQLLEALEAVLECGSTTDQWWGDQARAAIAAAQEQI